MQRKICFTFFLSIFICTFLSSCYTIEQSYHQIKILMSQEPLTQAIQDNKDNAVREEKLKLVAPVLKFTETEIHLTPKSSYKKYIELNSPYVSWVVMAANKRSLKLKTWWFPFVGEQPYLGFFNKKDALDELKKLKNENYDVSMGGVKAFSLLGYYPDPIYSSMLDGVSTPDFIETLIHETVHKTIYVNNNYAFNENLANFIARKATSEFLKIHPELGINSENYEEKYKREQLARQKFYYFFMSTKTDLEKFYSKTNNKNETEFVKIRGNKFDEISASYLTYMNGDEKNTNFEYAFSKGKFNNAVFLSYAVYEEDQKPLEDIYVKSNSNITKMVDRLRSCLYSYSDSKETLWSILTICFP